MPFQPIQAKRRATSVIHQIEQLILRGILRPGEQLPSERDLAERFGVSRPSLRDAIADLEKRDLLISKAGSGVFVTKVLGSAFSAPLVTLFSTHGEALFDYLSFRRDLEGLAAERAAEFASETDLMLVQQLFTKLEIAHEKGAAKDEARLDAEFHLSIIEASHNVIMLHMMRSMYDMLQRGVFYNRQITFQQHITSSTLLEQHRVINQALQNRDPKGARQAVEDHLNYVEQAMRDHKKFELNENIARQRFDHEQGR